MNILHLSMEKLAWSSWLWSSLKEISPAPTFPSSEWDPLTPLRRYLDGLPINNLYFAHRLCQLIPAQCPFERDIKWGDRVVCHIPALCKFNPLYQELMMLRFRALCYLVDECGQDVKRYC
jgi:hypothetical protein